MPRAPALHCRAWNRQGERLVATGVRLRGNKGRTCFFVRARSQSIQDSVHNPASREHTQTQGGDHRGEKNNCCQVRVQVRPALRFVIRLLPGT
jgi:hypothetical protein